MTARSILEQLPKDWLEQHWTEYLKLNERILVTLVQVKAHEISWQQTLNRPEDFESFFQAEAKRLAKKPDEIRGFFQQIAQSKAREQIFEKHFGHLVPRDAAGNPTVTRKDLEPIVGPALQYKSEAS
ncbi:MAG: hypothetical protein RRB13_15435 [bacterium]|nr:hypothetical protein [bacterium]